MDANPRKWGVNRVEYECIKKGGGLAQRHRDAERAGIFFWRLGVFV